MLLIMIFGCCTSVVHNYLKQEKHVFVPSGFCVQKSCQHCQSVYEKWSTQLVKQIHLNKKFKSSVIIKKKFAQQFLIKFMEMNSKSNKSAVKIKICYHGTLEKNYKSIIRSNLIVPDGMKVCHRTDKGFFGNGIYMSPHYKIANNYSSNSQVFVCLSLPGKRYTAKDYSACVNDVGISLKAGYDSHISPNGTEWVFFQSCQLLPCYLININRVHEVETELLKYVIPFVENLK